MRLTAIAGLLLLALAHPARADINVAASIAPVHSLVAAVMDGAGEPVLLADPARSPHGYASSSEEAAALQQANLVFRIGPGLESFLDEALDTLPVETRVVDLIESRDLELLPLRDSSTFDEYDYDEYAGYTHGDVNPHIWLDPTNAQAMVRVISRQLSHADPRNAGIYRRNATRLREELKRLSSETAAFILPYTSKRFIVYHDAYAYFERRFRLEAVGAVAVDPEIMPDADRMSEVRDAIGRLRVACVFAEPQFETDVIETIIDGTNARTGVLDPLGSDLDPGPDHYFRLIRSLATSFRRCLSG